MYGHQNFVGYSLLVLTLYVLYTANGTANVKPATQVQAITIFVPKIVNRVSIGSTIAVNRSYVTAHKLNTAVINKAPGIRVSYQKDRKNLFVNKKIVLFLLLRQNSTRL